MITPGLYQHYKGAMYRVLMLVKCSETQKSMVVYSGQSGVWVRPEAMFIESVTTRTGTVPRFNRVGE